MVLQFQGIRSDFAKMTIKKIKETSEGGVANSQQVSVGVMSRSRNRKCEGFEENGCLECLRQVCAQTLSRVQLFATPCTVACQTSLSMGFSRQEYWTGFPFLHQESFPIQRLNPCLLCLLHHWKADSLPLPPTRKPLRAVQLDQRAHGHTNKDKSQVARKQIE